MESAQTTVRLTHSQPFLVTGMAKSGTTFVQRMLDLHPEISCPPEQSFPVLEQLLHDLLGRYAEELHRVDRRTGGQGTPPFAAGTMRELLAAIIPPLSRALARGRRIHGLKEGTPFLMPQFFDELLGRPRIICIVRNVVDVGISTWRHNTRLAAEEPENAAAHLAMLANPANNLEGFIEKLVPEYRAQFDAFLAYAQGRPNFHIVLYEHLTALKKPSLRSILAFLGAARTEDILDPILAGSTREAMAARATRPEFFGLESRQKRGPPMDREFRAAMLREAMTPGLQRLGYSVEGLMVGY